MIDFTKWIQENHIDIMRAVDITSLTSKENRGFSTAIIFLKSLPRTYINQLREGPTDYSVFHETESNSDALADKLAAEIIQTGYQVIAQSEKGLLERGEFDMDTKTSYLPHKKIAVMSGIGWIGKSQ